MGAFDHMARGYLISDIITIFGTYDIVMGECDQMRSQVPLCSQSAHDRNVHRSSRAQLGHTDAIRQVVEEHAEGKVSTEIDDIVSRYPIKRSALIPLLYLAQREQGYITEAAMVEIAGILRIDASTSVRDRHLLHDVQSEAGGKIPHSGL